MKLHPCGDETCTEDHGEERAMTTETYHILNLVLLLIILLLLIVPFVRR